MRKHITAITAAVVSFAAIAVNLETPTTKLSTVPSSPPVAIAAPEKNSVEKIKEPLIYKSVAVVETPKALSPTPTPYVPPKCPDHQWIWADDGKCHDKPVKQPKISRSNSTCEDYRNIVAKYNWDVNIMLYAMRKESGCNHNAVGDNYTINGVFAPSCGLLQVRTLKGRPSCEELKDPHINIEWAYKIYLGQGYRAWTTLW